MPELKMYLPDGAGWKVVATADSPLKYFYSGLQTTWITFGGGDGIPLKQKQHDGSYIVVAREGVAGRIYGNVTDLNGVPFVGHFVVAIADGPNQFDIITTTDAQGYYHLDGLEIGKTYTVSYYRTKTTYYSRQNPHVEVRISLTHEHPTRLENVVLAPNEVALTPYWPGTTQFSNTTWDTGWHADTQWDESERDDNGARKTTTNGGSLVNAGSCIARSTEGWTGDEFSSNYRETSNSAAWVDLPMDIFQAEMASTLESLQGLGFYRGAVLEYIAVEFNLQGWSVEKAQCPWMNFYYHEITTIKNNGGVAYIWYQQDNHEQERLVNYEIVHDNTLFLRDSQLPLIRDRAYTHEQDPGNPAALIVPLNELGNSTSYSEGNRTGGVMNGFRTEYKWSHILPADFSGNAQYHLYVSDVPEPDRLGYNDRGGSETISPLGGIAPGHSWDNYLGFIVTPKFVYQYY